jgi:putative PIN family toxin of toxin-antitoxin system
MPRAVFDTNVIVAGFLSPEGAPGRIVEWLRAGTIQAVLDDRVAAEYAEVLARPRFRLPSAEVAVVLGAIVAAAFRVEVRAEDAARRLPDPTDAPFLECARAADAPLVTGNLRHYPRAAAPDIHVLTPAQYVDALKRLRRR